MRVYTGGTFDLFHRGHIDLLKHCRKIAGRDGRVIVALNTDEFIEKFKGKKPVMSYEERKAVLESCRYVDEVIENVGGEDSKKTIEEYMQMYFGDLSIDAVVVGSDWHEKDYLKQMQFTWEWLHEKGISLTYIPRVIISSSTEIKSRFDAKK